MQKIKRLNKKRFSILIVIIIVVIALALTFIFFRDQFFSNKFEWHDMTWTKERFGSIPVYKLNMEIYRPNQKEPFYYELYLRNAPRKLEKMPADITIKFPKKVKVYVSFDRGPLQCPETVLASYKLGEFINALGHEKEGAVASEDLLNDTGYENASDKVKNCNDVGVELYTHKVTSVVLLKSSDMPYSYVHQNGYCYILEIQGCESVKTSERFILSIIDLMRQEPKLEEQENNITNQSNQSSEL